MPFLRFAAAAAGDTMKASSARVASTFVQVTGMPAENVVRF